MAQAKKDGAARRRAQRTYYGVTKDGKVRTYETVEARYRDIEAGDVRQVTAHELRAMGGLTVTGARPSVELPVTYEDAPREPRKADGAAPMDERTMFEITVLLDQMGRLVNDINDRFKRALRR